MAVDQDTRSVNKTETEQVLEKWRFQALNVSLRISLIPGFMGFLLSLISDAIPNPDQRPFTLVYLFVWITFAVLAFNTKINQRLRGWGFIFGVYLLAILGLMRGGLTGDGRLFLLILPVMAIILIDTTAGIITTLVGMATMVVFTLLATSGLLQPFVLSTLMEKPFSLEIWLPETIYTYMIMWVMFTMLYYFSRFLVSRIEKERLMLREISEARSMLEQYNLTLEDKVAQRTNELATAMNEAQEARLAAEAGSRAKSAFLATMSHEIRTPLNAIIGMTSLLLDTPLTIKQGEFTETIRTSSEQLLSLISEILDFSKIEAGRLELEQTPFVVRQCLESIIDQVILEASGKQIELLTTVDPGVPVAIIGDETRFRQILLNLLSNAVKFTEHGEIEVAMRAEAIEDKTADDPNNGDEHAKTRLIISVRDTGIGIPVNQMARLFKSFSQGDTSTTRRYGGTGLGLVISQRLVEMMNGEIWVESEEGRGSTFYFTIEALSSSSPRRKAAPDSRLDLRNKRILIVDDNTTNRRILILQLQAWSMQSKATGSPSEALQWIHQGEFFDAVLLDKDMKEMDGISLAKEIMKLQAAQNLPLLLFAPMGYTAPVENEDLFSSLLTKPVKASQLYNALIAIFASEVEEFIRQTTEILPQFDQEMGIRHPLRILSVEDNSINQTLVLLMLERLGYRVDVAANGLEALQALRRQAYDVVLMDIQMPKMDGLEATRHIRQEFDLSLQPRIVAITANAMSGDRDACLAAGMDDYISKPIRIEELIDCLNRCPSREIREQSLAQAGFGIERTENIEDSLEPLEPEDVFAIIDMNELLRLKGTLSSRVDIMLPSLVSSYFKQAEKLLYDARQACTESRLDDLCRTAHTLKSNSTSFGAMRLADIARRIEEQSRHGIKDDLESLLNKAQVEYTHVREALPTAQEMVLKGTIEAKK